MLKIIYVHDLLFYNKNNVFYTSSNMPEIYFDRFFNVADVDITICSRIAKVKEQPVGFTSIKNKHLGVYCKGVSSYLQLFNPKKIYDYMSLVNSCDFLVVNLPSIHGAYVLSLNLILRKPYSIEFAADFDQFDSKKGGKFISFIMKPLMVYFAKKARGGTYVSRYLQKKFPINNENSIVASNVNIREIKLRESYFTCQSEKLRIVFVGGLNKRKGLFFLLTAIQLLTLESNLNVTLDVIGGHADRDWESLTELYGIRERVCFHGVLDTEDIYQILDVSHLYVQPSLTEGIPRASIEAMSRGLPVIATELPGFREILVEDVLIKPGSAKEIKDKILEFINNPSLFKKHGLRNSIKAESFLYDKLNNKRSNYYSKTLDEVEYKNG